MIYKIKNSKTIVLLLILMVSTGLATIIQFVKGKLFQTAIDLSLNGIIKFSVILGIFIVFEVLFYYLEWKYENYLVRNTIAYQKKQVMKNCLNIIKFNNIEQETKVKSNILVNTIESLEMNYYYAMFDSLYLIFRIVFVTAAILYINLFIGILIFVFLFIPLIITRVYKENVGELEKKYQDQKGLNLNLYRNIFENIKQIRILNARDLFFGNIKKQIEEEKVKGQRSKEYKLRMNAFNSFFSYLLHFITLTASVMLVYRGEINPGLMITLLGLTEQLSLPVLSLSRNINDINSTKQLRDEIDMAAKVTETKEVPITFNNMISGSNVKAILGDKTLQYKDLKFQRDKKYLIEGSSGIGKSVYLNIITGLYDLSDGKVLYDDQELTANQNPLTDICLVSAEYHLFAQSSIFNILLREEYSEDEKRYIEKFISKEIMEKDDATKLSSGEKRRLLNLRGLMSNKSTLIFDEPTANLDEKNSELFWNELLDIRKTIIVVSHDAPGWVREHLDFIVDFK